MFLTSLFLIYLGDMIVNFLYHQYIKALAFADLEIPINGHASMLAPKVEAKIIDSLELNKKIKALHIGTGSGFFSVLLASHVKSY